MKIRQGFVSNSSTTSFCLYGAMITSPEGGDYDWFDKKLEGHKNLEEFQHPETYGNEPHYVGQSLSSMKDDQTFGDFKKQVEAEMKAIFGNEIMFGVLENGWYDG